MSDARDMLARLRAAIEGPDGPPIAWTLRGYGPGQLPGDVVAGLTVATLIVPLSIGYAAVAGLPPEMGLYASVAPLLAYAVLGSGRRLILGPDAASAAMIGATIAPLAATQDDRVRLASALGLLVAAVFLAMRLARMGFLADLLSRPILVGYLAGVGITVVAGQVPKILGGPAIADALAVLTRVDWTAANPQAVAEAVRLAVEASGADLASVLLGGGVIVAMLLGRRFAPRVPMALPAMLVALVVSAALDLQAQGVQVLGPVPSGLPPVGLPTASVGEVISLLPGAVGIALLTFADTAATGRTFAARHGERTDPNRELVALSVADAAASLTGGYAVSSSPSRTSASEGAGSTSGMTGIVAAAAVLVVLVLLTGPLAALPIPALGAVILLAVIGLIDIPQIVAIWRVKATEGAIAVIAAGGVIVYGTLIGVGIAVLLAALNVVRRAAAPPILEEWRRADGTWRAATASEPGVPVAGVLVVRFAGPLFFANATALQAKVRALVAARPDAGAAVLDLGATSTVDLTAADALRGLRDELERGGRRLVVARPLGNVRAELRAFGLAGLMDATEGTRGSVDDTIRGLGLDPTRPAPGGSAAPDAAPGGQPAAPGGSAAPIVPAEPEGPPGNRLVLRVLAVAGVVIVAAAVIGVAVAGWAHREPTTSGPVPNIVGMSLDRARIAASDAGFELTAPIAVRRENQPEGTVVAQDPPAGVIADRGSRVQPIVTTGRELVVVPDVVLRPEAEAIAELAGLGLGVRRTGAVPDPSVPAGLVLSTDPAAGASVASGTSVGYVVSSGPPSSAGPSLSPRPSPAAGSSPSAGLPAARSPTGARPGGRLPMLC